MTINLPQGTATQFGDDLDGIMSTPLTGIVGVQSERLIRLAHEAVRMQIESALSGGMSIREGSMACRSAGSVH